MLISKEPRIEIIQINNPVQIRIAIIGEANQDAVVGQIAPAQIIVVGVPDHRLIKIRRGGGGLIGIGLGGLNW